MDERCKPTIAGLVSLLFFIVLFTGHGAQASRCSSRTVLLNAMTGSATLSFRNYGQQNNRQYCRWKIRAYQPNYAVRLRVVNLELNYPLNCSRSSLSIYNADYQRDNQLLARYCGRTFSSPYLTSTGRYMYIVFKYDGSGTTGSFQLQYRAVRSWDNSATTQVATTSTPTTTTSTTACLYVQTLNARYGYSRTLSSPNYPRNYPNNMNCEWKITADRGFVVRLSVTLLDLEYEWRCDKDSLSVYDADSLQASQRLAKLCGRQNNLPYKYSTGRYMYIQFRTDGSTTRQGFLLQYTAVARPVTTTTATTLRPNHNDWASCGGSTETLYAPIGLYKTLDSPNYPQDYFNNMNCGWKISTGWNYVIRLSVTALDLEFHSHCDYDSLSVYDADPQFSHHRLVKLCGNRNNVPDIYSTGRHMYINFVTDGSETKRGFQLRYTAVRSSMTTTIPSIGTELFAETGEQKDLKSSNYPFSYDSYRLERWHITCIAGYVIHLHVVDMDLQSRPHCSENKVTVYDSNFSRPIATMCNYRYIGVDLYSRNKEMYVDFDTSAAEQGKGFRLLYQAVPSFQANYWHTTRPAWDTFTTTTASAPYVSHRIGALVGGLTGAFVLLFLVVCCGWCLRMRSKKQRPPVARLSTAAPNPTPGSPVMYPNTSSAYVLPGSQPNFNGYLNMAYSSNSDDPPPYFALQHNNFIQGTAAASCIPNIPATAPPMYDEAMMTSHPPSKGTSVDAPASSVHMGTDLPPDAVAACPTSPPDQREPVPRSFPDSASSVEHGATRLALHDNMPAQPAEGAPPAYLAVDNISP